MLVRSFATHWIDCSFRKVKFRNLRCCPPLTSRRKTMSKRNAIKNALPGSILIIGLDIGYGVVKAVTSDQVVMFPSVTGHAREIKFQQEDLAQRHPGDQITD